MSRTKKQISMAEAAMIQSRTFVQPLDISSAITVDELFEVSEQMKNYATIDVDMAWELFKAMNLGEAIFDGDKS